MPVTRLMLAAAVTTLLAAAVPGPAAADPLPVPAIAQYVETLPTSAGGAVAAGKPHVRALPPQAAQKVEAQGGSDAAALSTIATSSAYGAPQASLPTEPPAATTTETAKPKPAPAKIRHRAPSPRPNATKRGAVARGATQTVSAGAGGGSSRLTALIVVLTALSASLAFAGVRGRG